MTDHIRLRVWQRAQELCGRLCAETAFADGDPAARRHAGLRSALLRSSLSVSERIATGAGRRTQAEFAHHLWFAIGDVVDTQRHLERARRAGLVRRERQVMLDMELQELRRMLMVMRLRLVRSGGDRGDQPDRRDGLNPPARYSPHRHS